MTKEVEARFQRIERNLEIAAALNAETAKLQKEHDKRLRMIEASLDGLIRAIRRQYPNGKGAK